MKEIYLNMPVGEYYGCGVLGKNMLRVFSKMGDVKYVKKGFEHQITTDEDASLVKRHEVIVDKNVDSPFIHIINNGIFESNVSFRGSPNIGWIFTEMEEFPSDVIKKLKRGFDIIVAGSEWNAEILRKHGVDAIAIPQGVNRNIFNSNHERKELKDKFVIFSGGKFEYRKAQDLVIKAVAEFQKEHKDVWLMTFWANIFSKRREMDVYIKNSSLTNTLMFPFKEQKVLAELMCQTDIGIFPNRVEGGTNLVLMEYLACGKPVIASYLTGQKDVLNKDYSFYAQNVEEILDHLEYAYRHRNVLKPMGENAEKAMGNFTWEKSAKNFLELGEAHV